MVCVGVSVVVPVAFLLFNVCVCWFVVGCYCFCMVWLRLCFLCVSVCVLFMCVRFVCEVLCVVVWFACVCAVCRVCACVFNCVFCLTYVV